MLFFLQSLFYFPPPLANLSLITMKSIRALEMNSYALVYVAMVVVTLAVDYLGNYDPFHAWKMSQIPSAKWIAIGLSVTIVYLIGALLSSRMFNWAINLDKVFRQILTPFSYVQIVFLALLSGFVEEWFFRGVLQPRFGIILTSIVFGLSHFLPERTLWFWSVTSFAISIVFGLIFKNSGSLLLLALMHSAINFVLLWRLNHSADRSHPLPSL